MEETSAKPHRKHVKGRKADKRKRQAEDENETIKKKNPKAFAIQKVNKLNRSFRRAQDVKTSKHHIPVVNRTPVVSPPIIVAVVGPPKVGKSTLLQGIIKHYTKQRISRIKGPVTLVSGKHRRLTLIECNNDVTAMIDIAKVADLVLLMIDASFGFEMEIFEFLNVCQVHGFPKVMGILTHLDLIKKPNIAKKTKNELKKRFWAELYKGAKLFYLSGMMHGEYRRVEILNLCRFISVMKLRPLTWRLSHPYLLADRMEDITDPAKIREEQLCDRDVTLYGYVRGTHLRKNTPVHIPGCGDFALNDVTYLPDPCPLPDQASKKKGRSLAVQERVIFAPMSGVGGIVYDKDAVYIDVVGETSARSETSAPAVMMTSLAESSKGLDVKMKESGVSMFTAGSELLDDDEDGFYQTSPTFPIEEQVEESGRVRRRAVFDEDTERSGGSGEDNDGDNMFEDDGDTSDDGDVGNDDDGGETSSQSDAEDSDGEIEKGGALVWKTNLKEKAERSFVQRHYSTANLQRVVYGEAKEEGGQQGADELSLGGGLFSVKKLAKDGRTDRDARDNTRAARTQIRDWLSDQQAFEHIADCFVTGSWKDDAADLLRQDDELYGEFEDLEGDGQPADEEAQATVVVRHQTERSLHCLLLKATCQDPGAETRKAKKQKLKEAFNRDYDLGSSGREEELFDNVKRQMEEQAQLNRAEFETMDEAQRAQYEGFRPGLYVRLELRGVPCEFVTNFDPHYPLVVGGLLAIERSQSYLRARVKRHRWYKRILKSRDPLIVSAGWRRYQTLPVYYMEDHNLRQRMLKYTPEHLHCWAVFYGPTMPQGLGFLCMQEVAGSSPDFRVAATGTILESDCSHQVVKKLKLVGYPHKIFKNTCFVKGMFNSALEVAKFEGASIQTVSGIRGRVKKALTSGKEGGFPAGSFRALFEDQVVMSDIVFCKTWYPVAVPKLYIPVSNLLQADKQKWCGIRTVGKLRHDKKLKPLVKPDSLYEPIVRKEAQESELKIPLSLVKELPFASRQKWERKKPRGKDSKHQRLMAKAVVKEKRDKQLGELMSALHSMRDEKRAKSAEERRKKIEAHKETMKKLELKELAKQKQSKKKLYKIMAGKRR